MHPRYHRCPLYARGLHDGVPLLFELCLVLPNLYRRGLKGATPFSPPGQLVNTNTIFYIIDNLVPEESFSLPNSPLE